MNGWWQQERDFSPFEKRVVHELGSIRVAAWTVVALMVGGALTVFFLAMTGY